MYEQTNHQHHITEGFLTHLCLASHIRKTRLYNSDPLKPNFYIVKMKFFKSKTYFNE